MRGLPQQFSKIGSEPMEYARFRYADRAGAHRKVRSDVDRRPPFNGGLPKRFPGMRLELAADQLQGSMQECVLGFFNDLILNGGCFLGNLRQDSLHLAAADAFGLALPAAEKIVRLVFA